MKKNSKKEPKINKNAIQKAYIEGAGIVAEKPITDTLEENYMPYAMSVIVSRALPEIDGFKPSHRKLLYTMYKMGLLNGARTKSANIVGQTMRLNPHGDMAIYETMVRLTRGNETLLHPYVDSKGNFGKAYSRDMSFAASRYTEAKLDKLCNEIFSDIDKDTVDFVPNYDNTMTEPALLPAKFPSILVNNNIGIAVSMSSNICSFNLTEVCETAVSLLRDPDHDIISTLKAPDFPGGGFVLYDEDELRKIYDTGRGSVKIRAKYNYDADSNVIEVTEIPPTTTVEAIIDRIVDLVKLGKIKEISDLRDETDLSGLKLALDLKRRTDPDALMQKLFKLTPLQDSFACNFNILIEGTPKVMGIREILKEWTDFRTSCIKRRITFDLGKKREKLHLLLGLQKILLDIDKAIKIIRETAEESEVVPNLMIGFGIDEVQAEFVAEIKLRHINKEYILKRLEEINDLKTDIADMEDTLESSRRIKNIIISDLKDIIAKYGQPRKTLLSYDTAEIEIEEEEEPDFNVNIFITKDGYFKKITSQSLRMSGEQKLKENDQIVLEQEVSNKSDLLFFTDKAVVYKSKVGVFEQTKASVMGDFVPAKLEFDNGESLVFSAVTADYSETLMLFFQNGKAAKIPLSSFETKTNRKKLANAYNTDSPLVAAFVIKEDTDFLLQSTAGKILIFSSALLMSKASRDTQGVQVMRLTKSELAIAKIYNEGDLENGGEYVVKNIPMAGKSADFNAGQMTFD
ncbi:MAG: DNA topoisomerase (ATP-hydrolyzing) subunit A [Firmicutes bacterium]|nr:DNA topoisomerase (ATP-hydrolyzing) subunit A [Bacillota bacterium]